MGITDWEETGSEERSHPGMKRALTHQSGCFSEGGKANNFDHTLCARQWARRFRYFTAKHLTR